MVIIFAAGANLNLVVEAAEQKNYAAIEKIDKQSAASFSSNEIL